MNTVYSDLVAGFKKLDESDKYNFYVVEDTVRIEYKNEYCGFISYYKNAGKYGFQPTLFFGTDNVEYEKVLNNIGSVVQEINGKVA